MELAHFPLKREAEMILSSRVNSGVCGSLSAILMLREQPWHPQSKGLVRLLNRRVLGSASKNKVESD